MSGLLIDHGRIVEGGSFDVRIKPAQDSPEPMIRLMLDDELDKTCIYMDAMEARRVADALLRAIKDLKR